jgi:hypothetical protein
MRVGVSPWVVGDAALPTVLREGPYRIYFHSHEGGEPPHVHVDRDAASAKFWIRPVRVAYNLGFKPHELSRIERLVSEHAETFLEAWRGYFGTESRGSDR